MSVNFQWGTTIPEMSATLIPYAMGDLERIKRFPTSEARKFLDDKLAAARRQERRLALHHARDHRHVGARSRSSRSTTSRASRSAASTR